MEITDVRLTRLDEGKVKAIGSITIDGCFVVRGVKVIEGNELFVAMPQYKKGNEWKDVCFALTPEVRGQINYAVLNAYEAL